MTIKKGCLIAFGLGLLSYTGIAHASIDVTVYGYAAGAYNFGVADTDQSATVTSADPNWDLFGGPPQGIGTSSFFDTNETGETFTLLDSDGHSVTITDNPDGTSTVGPDIPPGAGGGPGGSAAPFLDFTASVASANPVAALASNGTGLIAVGVAFCAFTWMMWTLTRKMHPGV